MFRRAYSDSAKARQLLKNAFKRMESAGYRKTDAQRDEIVKAARELNVAPQVATQVYDSTALPESTGGSHSSSTNVPLTEAARRRAVQQVNAEMFGPPCSEQYHSADFQYDDLPSLAHLHLEEHREARKFVRAAAYELPLLAQYRSAYRAPARTENLKFKHFAFPTESQNPAARKVVLTFKPKSTGLPANKLHALKLLAGRRYDSARDEVRMSANNFETQAQNKRYLAQLYERLCAAARDGADSFEDVPLDERQALRRAKRSALYPLHYKWPEAWSRPDLAPKAREDIYAVLGAHHPACALTSTK